MSKRFISQVLPMGVLMVALGTMNGMAGTVFVHEEGGTFNFKLTADGLGTFSIDYQGAQLTSINNALIPTGPIASLLPVVPQQHQVLTAVTSGTTTTYTLAQAIPSDKFIGVGLDAILTAELEYKFLAGTAINPGFLNLTGEILSVPASSSKRQRPRRPSTTFRPSCMED